MLKRAVAWLGSRSRTGSIQDGSIDGLVRRLEEYAAAQGLDEEGRYRLAERLTCALYPRFLFSEFGRIHLDDEAFLAYYRRFMDPGNWHSHDRKYLLKEMLTLVEHVTGDLAECGTYRGATAYLMCGQAQARGRHLHLFDSFQGLSNPGNRDGDYWLSGALRADESELHANLAGFSCYTAYSGWIPTRFAEVAGRRFCFCHIDVDLYQPTLDSLAFFYPRMNAGGVMLFDDYGFRSCPGARAAIDEYFGDRSERPVLVPTGQAFVIRDSTGSLGAATSDET